MNFGHNYGICKKCFKKHINPNKGKIKERISKKCIICKELFFETPYRIRKRKYCNNPCYGWGNKKEKRICPFCNEIFFEWKSQEKVTCGKKICHSKQLSKVKKGIINMEDENPKCKNKRFEVHQWIKRRKPKPQFCEICKLNPIIDLANISQEYKYDINDFFWSCRSCHMKFDFKVGKRKIMRKI